MIDERPWLRDLDRPTKREQKPCGRHGHQKVYSNTVAVTESGTHLRCPQVHWVCRKCLIEGCGFSQKREPLKYERIIAFKYAGTDAQ